MKKNALSLRTAAFSVVFLAALLVSCTATAPSPRPTPSPASALEPTATPSPAPTPPVAPGEAIKAHAVDPALLLMVSKFRSMIGHGSYFTPGWSSKHYFVPLPSVAYGDDGVPLYSPVDGVVWRMIDERPRPRGDMSGGGAPEESGRQVHIRVSGNDAMSVVLYHVTVAEGIEEGMTVRAGQRVGYANVKGNSFDIAVEMWEENEASYLSYFELLPDRLFADYQRLGIASRSHLIITEERRQANPLEFGSTEASIEGWLFLKTRHERRSDG